GALLDELDGQLIAETALVPGERPVQVADRQLQVMDPGEGRNIRHGLPPFVAVALHRCSYTATYAGQRQALAPRGPGGRHRGEDPARRDRAVPVARLRPRDADGGRGAGRGRGADGLRTVRYEGGPAQAGRGRGPGGGHRAGRRPGAALVRTGPDRAQ